MTWDGMHQVCRSVLGDSLWAVDQANHRVRRCKQSGEPQDSHQQRLAVEPALAAVCACAVSALRLASCSTGWLGE